MRILQWPAAAAMLVMMAGCNSASQQPLPTVVLGNASAAATRAPQPSGGLTNGAVTASGIVAPEQQTRLAFMVAERVTQVNVAVGDEVKAGQTLAQLDDAVLQAQIKQAQSAVVAAQAQRDLLTAGPTDAQLRQVKAALLVATAGYSRTIAGARPAAVAAAQATLAAATDAYDKVKAGPLPESYAAAEAAYRNADAALKQAQFAYDAAFKQNPAAIGASPLALALQQATNNHAAAKSTYDLASRQPDAAGISAAFQQVQAARAALDAASSPARDYDVAQAQAQVDAAQAALEALLAAPRKQQVDAAQAQVDVARSALDILQAQSAQYTLLAPFDGVVMNRAIQPGEVALPGAAALIIADLTHLRVDTTDLSERDIVQVTIGQPVTVNIKVLGQTVSGKVALIAPSADTLGGDVVYKTSIALDKLPAGMRPGMSAEVQFGR